MAALCPECGHTVKPLKGGTVPAHNVRRVGRLGGSNRQVYGVYDTGRRCYGAGQQPERAE